ncbi:MAG: flagellar hook-length control protein FliK [Roseburia sp.]|uniref:flagellar hook-length control protein FliK n=1 Tax=Roseburia sp. 831b TaxID=1261635 RepID=UPI000950ED3F|nr:flagellar hook-length control protein FliK [Roseburia sp. 831b]MCI5919523.1 flagellar hook-length control protein FliK [Roseburia sp.]MDD6215345.1 flagellar hook-length control protein FliK [Roseburia sp.]WVK73588.1 flagellar hook-length control protein FliK [Roseburia sp. 831b]
MQISDMLGQYNRNVTAGSENLTGVKGVEQLVSSLKELKVGNVFEGTVNAMKNGQVMLGLSNGQTILARLDGKLSLTVGESMFFQVKMNDGTQIAIRPFSGTGNAANPTLLNALFAAGLPANEKNLNMVDAMMREQMSIDKQSLNEMMKAVLSNEKVPVATIVQMTKLHLPISPEMAAQFENYQNDSHAILNEIDTMIEDLPGIFEEETLSQKQIVNLNHGLLDVIGNGEILQETGSMDAQETANMVSHAGQETPDDGAMNLQGMSDNTSQSAEELTDGISNVQEEGVQLTLGGQEVFAKDTLGSLLNSEQAEILTRQLQEIPEVALNGHLFTQEMQEEEIVPKLNLHLSAAQFLKEVDENLMQAVKSGTLSTQDVFGETADGPAGKLLSSKTYAAVLKNVLEQQWLLKPENLKEKEKISELYERLDHQMEKIEQVLKESGIQRTSLSETMNDIRSNIEFMNQINQTYTYVQMPLKLVNQNANGELYVYTNKKSLHDPESELSAFLHLELDHLGTTDVSIKMRPKTKEVSTNFYLDDDEAYRLIAQNMPILEDRLTRKGYHCTMTVTKGEKDVNFVDDFLKKDQRSVGTLHRYSFDVRA